MTLLLASAARATVGGRSGQEDAFRLWPGEGVVPPKAEGGGLLAVLADGMGGHTGGAIAGQTACKTFTEVFASAATPVDVRLKTALNASNEALAKGVEQNAALKGMGCTLVAAWIDDLGIRWTSVGNSLLLLYRLPDVIRLNADHSLGSFLDEQARQNRITRSEARRNRNRNALRSALTGSKIDLIDLRSEPLELRPGDWVLLASDGICSLPGDEIADVVYHFRQSTPEQMAEGLIAAITQKGVVDQDNATVVAVRIEGAPEAAGDGPTRVLNKPSKGEEVDLKTRRIGVSRRSDVGRRSGGRGRAAVWLAAAVALVFCAVALLLAIPALRPAAPDVTSGARSTTAPASAVMDPGPAGVAPLPKTAPKRGFKSDPGPPQTTPPESAPGGREPGSREGQEGAVHPAPSEKSAATRPSSSGAAGEAVVHPSPPKQTGPHQPGEPVEAEVGTGTRSSVVRPPPPKPRPPVKASASGEVSTSRASKDQAKTKHVPAAPTGPMVEPPREEVPKTDPLSNAEH